MIRNYLGCTIYATNLRYSKYLIWALKIAGNVHRYDGWLPHDLTKRNLIDYISICDSLLKNSKNNLFWKKKDNEKWIVYHNIERMMINGNKRSHCWLLQNAVCIWICDVVYYEFFPQAHIWCSDKNCIRLTHLNEKKKMK